jgi:Kelch motif
MSNTHDFWTTVAPLPTARAGLAAALGPDGRVYAIGGSGNSSSAPTTVEAYTV